MNKKMIIQNKKLLKQGFYPTKDLTWMRDTPVENKLVPGFQLVREDGENAVMHMLKTEYDNLVERHGKTNAFSLMAQFVLATYKSDLHEIILHGSESAYKLN